MAEHRVRLALTVGDPGGIGPEITASLLVQGMLRQADTYIIGSASALEEALPRSFRKNLEVVSLDAFESGKRQGTFPAVIDTGDDTRPPAGRPSAEGGRVAGRSIESAVALARRREVEGIVTGPISKEALHMAGYPYRGHTGMFADLFESPDCQMMMVAGRLRIVILTRDMPLKDVPGALTAERITASVKVTDGALREIWGIKEPRILVAALNPHAGDGGINGREEIDIIIPALEELLSKGYNVGGPLSADTMFYRWEEKGYDAFVALYHDQGMIPFKMGGFERGVNMTIGLPVVRTSVCHGTAFDIAGLGEGEAGSLEAAFSLAVQCCLARRKNTEIYNYGD